MCGLGKGKKQTKGQKRFYMSIYNPIFLPRMKRSVIGLFGRVMNNNELCSDWLFHSAAYQQEGNTERKIYI